LRRLHLLNNFFRVKNSDFLLSKVPLIPSDDHINLRCLGSFELERVLKIGKGRRKGLPYGFSGQRHDSPVLQDALDGLTLSFLASSSASKEVENG
jgi:hypothetical protein